MATSNADVDMDLFKLAAPVQVICKYSCTNMESSEYRNHIDVSPTLKTSTGVAHGSVFEQEGDKVEIIMPYIGYASFIIFMCFELWYYNSKSLDSSVFVFQSLYYGQNLQYSRSRCYK